LLLLCAIVLSCSINVFSQTSIEYTSDTLKVKRKFHTIKETFDKQSYDNLGSKIWRAVSESRFIKEGDSIRIKYTFNPNWVMGLELENGLVIPYKNLRKGEWIATVKLDKTTNVRARFTIKNIYSGRVSHPYSNQVIVVLDSVKYKEVSAKVKEFEKNEDDYGLNEYLKSLAGEDILKTRRAY
ncbi:MAG: hypothetical protein IKY11_04860, partial [Rikenellaceae bacterium]|nr:hypothetical protein [Rikenellaceae bacterium]